MDEERLVISSSLAFTPETVASRTFNAVFRGYDQNEVRSFLKRVADEMAAAASREAELRQSLQDAMARVAHPEVDEEVLTNALGEHAARLLTNAREAAGSMTSDAETRSARILQDTEAKIARMRADADNLLARRTEEAERLTMGLRQAAEADARALRERARAEAEAEVEAARAQGREMVSEARSVRERMLADLTRRQRAAEAQVDQLRSVRQRLLQAYAVVRRTVDEATAELGRADSETTSLVEAATRVEPTGMPSGPVPVIHAEPVIAVEGRPIPAPGPGAPLAPSARPVEVADPLTVEAPLAVPEPAKSDAQPAEAPHDRPETVDRGRIPPFRPAPMPGSTEPPSPSAGPDPVAGLGSAGPPEEHSGPPVVHLREAQVAQEPQSSADDIFARIRSAHPPLPEEHPPDERAAPTAAEAPEEAPSEAPQNERVADTGVSSTADESILYRRDELLDPIDGDLARQLKRVLQDEQNDVLDRLRRQRQPASDSTLPDFVAQTERYQVVAAPLLRSAAHRGAGFVAGSTDDPVAIAEPPEKVAEEWAADLAVEIVVPLRERLEAVLNEAKDATNGDVEAVDSTIADRLSASYRQWKVQQIEQVARHHATAAFVRGAFAATPDGSKLRWVVDDEGPCPDCDDNALAGPTPRGQEFPTGQIHPPAHQGCRCLVVVSD